MNRRKFIEYSIKTIALASVPVINFFPKVNISEDEKKLPWSSNTFKFPLENFKLQNGEILKNAFLLVDVNGELNQSKSNAIILATCFAGSHKFNQMAYGINSCLLYTSPSPRDNGRSRMPSSA